MDTVKQGYRRLAYSSMPARLRVLGFCVTEVLASFQWETLMLCIMGGIGGAALSLVFNGCQTGTANFQPISDLSFATIIPGLILQGVAFRIVMDMVGGFPPARCANRVPVTEAMKEE